MSERGRRRKKKSEQNPAAKDERIVAAHISEERRRQVRDEAEQKQDFFLLGCSVAVRTDAQTTRPEMVRAQYDAHAQHTFHDVSV